MYRKIFLGVIVTHSPISPHNWLHTIRNSYWLCTILDSYWSWLVTWLDIRLIHMIDSYELWLRTIPVVYKASLIRSRTLVSSRLIPCISVLALEYDPFLTRTLLTRCYYSGRRRSTYRIVRSVTEELTLKTLSNLVLSRTRLTTIFHERRPKDTPNVTWYLTSNVNNKKTLRQHTEILEIHTTIYLIHQKKNQ